MVRRLPYSKSLCLNYKERTAKTEDTRRGDGGEEQETNTNDFQPYFHSLESNWWSSRIFPFGQTMDHGLCRRPFRANNALRLPYSSGSHPRWVTIPLESLKKYAGNRPNLRTTSHNHHVRVTPRVRCEALNPFQVALYPAVQLDAI